MPNRRDITVLVDHPRSRGVYVGSFAASWRGAGSSPLARGLRGYCVGRTCDPGIIPARAGFTDDIIPFATVEEDHPRSRGVYLTL